MPQLRAPQITNKSANGSSLFNISNLPYLLRVIRTPSCVSSQEVHRTNPLVTGNFLAGLTPGIAGWRQGLRLASAVAVGAFVPHSETRRHGLGPTSPRAPWP